MTKKLAFKSRDKIVTLVLIVGYLFSLATDQCEHMHLLNKHNRHKHACRYFSYTLNTYRLIGPLLTSLAPIWLTFKILLSLFCRGSH